MFPRTLSIGWVAVPATPPASNARSRSVRSTTREAQSSSANGGRRLTWASITSEGTGYQRRRGRSFGASREGGGRHGRFGGDRRGDGGGLREAGRHVGARGASTGPAGSARRQDRPGRRDGAGAAVRRRRPGADPPPPGRDPTGVRPHRRADQQRRHPGRRLVRGALLRADRRGRSGQPARGHVRDPRVPPGHDLAGARARREHGVARREVRGARSGRVHGDEARGRRVQRIPQLRHGARRRPRDERESRIHRHRGIPQHERPGARTPRGRPRRRSRRQGRAERHRTGVLNPAMDQPVPGVPRPHPAALSLGGSAGAWADATGPVDAGARNEPRGPASVSGGLAPVEVRRPRSEEVVEPDIPWIVIVWNDPINLMSYVTWVFQKLFGYPKAKAEKLMWDVHTKGKAVVASGEKEQCEIHVSALHGYGLWATMQKDR